MVLSPGAARMSWWHNTTSGLCNGRLTDEETHSIRVGITQSGLTSVHLHYPTIFLQIRCFSCATRSPVARPLGRHVQYTVTYTVFRWFDVQFEPRPG